MIGRHDDDGGREAADGCCRERGPGMSLGPEMRVGGFEKIALKLRQGVPDRAARDPALFGEVLRLSDVGRRLAR